MAVQAQYPPSNVLFLNGGEQERPGTEFSQAPPLFLDQSQIFFASNGGVGNPKKRGRDDLLVSTGLKLAFENHHQSNGPFLSDEFAAQIKHQTDEIDSLIRAHGEELRRGVAGRRQRHARAVLDAMERRLREKEAELDRAARHGAELEDRLARLRSESLAWQAKAAADQAVAAALHAQLQQAARAGDEPGECPAESPAEDAGSQHVDPNRAEPPTGLCRACGARHVSVVLLPCRHLCLCGTCDAAGAAAACPLCGALRSGSVHVFLS